MMNGLGWFSGFLLSWTVATSAIAIKPGLDVSIVSAGQEGPVQVIGFKPTEGPGTMMLHVRNVSSKATHDFWVVPLVRSSSGQVYRSSNIHAAVTPELGSLAPGSDTWDTYTGGILLPIVEMAAKDLHSTCLRVTPMITDVEFADGTSWKANAKEVASAMTRADLKGGAPACTEFPGASDYLRDLDVIGMNANLFDSFKSEEPSGSQSFSFACSLHRVSEASVRAMCSSYKSN